MAPPAGLEPATTGLEVWQFFVHRVVQKPGCRPCSQIARRMEIMSTWLAFYTLAYDINPHDEYDFIVGIFLIFYLPSQLLILIWEIQLLFQSYTQFLRSGIFTEYASSPSNSIHRNDSQKKSFWRNHQRLLSLPRPNFSSEHIASFTQNIFLTLASSF